MSLMNRRPADSYKNSFGRVLVMAGSPGMAGAAVLCGSAALRTGSGLVRYCVPVEIRDVLQIAVPEATCLPRTGDTLQGTFEAMAVGPGLGTDEGDRGLLLKMLAEFEGTIVLDADGLNDVVRFGLQEELRNAKPAVIITPHEGEAARLLQVERIRDRERAVCALQENFGVTAVLKGSRTLVTDGTEIWINTNSGNPGMATGGSGDVLTGIIASLAGQGLTPLEAAKAGVYLHGLAGDICRDEMGESGMLAGDICRAIPKAINEISL